MKPTRPAGIRATMRRWPGILVALMLSIAGLSSQSPLPIDTSKHGPQVGSVVPGFAGVDQFGRPQTLASIVGPKGAMIVFFRSADW
jgi:hypothetical protein